MLNNRGCGKKKQWGTHSELGGFVFLRNCYTRWSPAFLEMAEHLPAREK